MSVICLNDGTLRCDSNPFPDFSVYGILNGLPNGHRAILIKNPVILTVENLEMAA